MAIMGSKRAYGDEIMTIVVQYSMWTSRRASQPAVSWQRGCSIRGDRRRRVAWSQRRRSAARPDQARPWVVLRNRSTWTGSSISRTSTRYSNTSQRRLNNQLFIRIKSTCTSRVNLAYNKGMAIPHVDGKCSYGTEELGHRLILISNKLVYLRVHSHRPTTMQNFIKSRQ